MEKEIKKIVKYNGVSDTCPKCGSEDIQYTGTIADGELATYMCNSCGHHWQEIR